MSIEFVPFYFFINLTKTNANRSFSVWQLMTQWAHKKTVLSKLFYRPYLSGKIMNHNSVLLDFVCVCLSNGEQQNGTPTIPLQSIIWLRKNTNANEDIWNVSSSRMFALLLDKNKNVYFKQFFIRINETSTKITQWKWFSNNYSSKSKTELVLEERWAGLVWSPKLQSTE